MASKKPFTKLQCSVCKRVNYFVHKSKQLKDKGEKKLEFKKYCKYCRKHMAHKEAKR